MAKFGQEQALLERSRLRQWTFRLVGSPHAGARLRLRALLQALEVLESSYGFNMKIARVLDAGCGKGEYSFFLSTRYPGWQITGFELDGCKTERAQATVLFLDRPNVGFVQGDLLELPNREEFDLAICLDVLEHIPDDQTAIQSLHSALKPNGFLILHVPGLVRPHFDIREHGHVREGYGNEEMSRKLKQAGFEILQVRNPIGFCGQWADDLCELLSGHPFLRGIGIPLYAVLVWLDQFGSRERQFPRGAGLLAVARKSPTHKAVPLV